MRLKRIEIVTPDETKREFLITNDEYSKLIASGDLFIVTSSVRVTVSTADDVLKVLRA